MSLTKSGKLFLIASCVYEDLDPQLSVFHDNSELADRSKTKTDEREEFVYNH